MNIRLSSSTDINYSAKIESLYFNIYEMVQSLYADQETLERIKIGVF